MKQELEELRAENEKLRAAKEQQDSSSSTEDLTTLVRMLAQQQQASQQQLTESQQQIGQLLTQLGRAGPSTPATARRSTPKPPSPPMLNTSITLAKFRSWRDSWNDYSRVYQITELPLEDQQALLRGTFSLEMRDVLKHILDADNRDTPDEILDKVEANIRKKHNILTDLVEFDLRKQQPGESFEDYLVAIKKLADAADLVDKHCNDCFKECIDRRLTVRLISGITDEEVRTKLLAMNPMPTP